MSRISAALAAAFAGAAVQMLALVRAEFDSGTLWLWTGRGDLSWNSETWSGAGGHIAQINLPTESAEIKAAGGSITLNGLDPAILALADTEPYQGRPITVYFGAKASDGSVVVDPDLAYEGTMDTMTGTEDRQSASIVLALESRSAQNERASNRRLTSEDQALTYPGDLAFDFVPVIQDRDYLWGPRG